MTLCVVCRVQGIEAIENETSSEIAGTMTAAIAGKWLAYDLNVPGAPAALEITADGHVNLFQLKILPDFNKKPDEEWTFSQTGDTEATVKSTDGAELALKLVKKETEQFVEIQISGKPIYLYRAGWQTAGETGFTGRWNMPSIPLMELKEDGTVLIPSGSPGAMQGASGDIGTCRIFSGNRIAVSVRDKEGVEKVIFVVKTTEDSDMLKFSIDEQDYIATGQNYDKPPENEFDPDKFVLIKGPDDEFFYSQPVVVEAQNNVNAGRQKALFLNCLITLLNLSNAEEMHYMDTGMYSTTPEPLDAYIGGCVDPAECAGATVAAVSKSCAPGTFSIGPGEADDPYSYTISAQAADESGCFICVTESGQYPEDYSGCPNTEKKCR